MKLIKQNIYILSFFLESIEIVADACGRGQNQTLKIFYQSYTEGLHPKDPVTAN